MRVSLALPQCVDVSAFRMFIVCLARVSVLLMCCEYVSFVSSVRPKIFGCLTVGSCVLFMCSVRVVEYSAGSGVKSVVVVFEALSVSWLLVVH